MDPNSLWTRILAHLRDTIGAEPTHTFLDSCKIVEMHSERLIIEAPNDFFRDWIDDNYREAIAAAALAVTSTPLTVSIELPKAEADNELGLQPLAQGAPRGAGVNERQTFDNFVIGECNRFAHAAAGAVAEMPAQQYNPLFIYGATGLGKTHLMHAIANEVLRRDERARIFYITGEQFMNELIDCIRRQRTEEFRTKYRKLATVLLVDDIQFIAGRDRTQEEFFHTFNALQTSGRQIVLTSDVVPKDIEKLEPRLRTRFEGGLLADMQAPDPETLLAILHQKAAQMSIHVAKDVAFAICGAVAGNIRELEGALNRIEALQSLTHEPLTLEIARQKMPDLLQPPLVQVSSSQLLDAVARYHNLRAADLIGKGRTNALVKPRHIAMYLMRKHCNLSFPELGRELGGRDHSTIQHGVKKVEMSLANDTDLSYKIRLIEQGLGLRHDRPMT